MNTKNYISALFATLILFSCVENKKDSLPAKPQDVNSVKTLVKGKKYTTQKAGFYGNLTVNGQTDVDWIDIAEKKEQLAKDPNNFTVETELKAVERETKFAVQFVNDTLATVFSNDANFSATYTIDDIVGEYDEDKKGVKLRLRYADPSFAFSNEPAMEMTYTFVVDGADDKSLLLQTPRTINRRPLIILLQSE